MDSEFPGHYSRSETRFASEFVAIRVLKKYVEGRREMIVQFLDETSSISFTGSVRRQVFEPLGHRIITALLHKESSFQAGSWLVRHQTLHSVCFLMYQHVRLRLCQLIWPCSPAILGTKHLIQNTFSRFPRRLSALMHGSFTKDRLGLYSSQPGASTRF